MPSADPWGKVKLFDAICEESRLVVEAQEDHASLYTGDSIRLLSATLIAIHFDQAQAKP